MKKKLFSLGNGWAVYLSANIIKLIGINPTSAKVVFTIEDNNLVIRELKETESTENMLVRKFIKSGKGFALYIPNSILELLEITPETDEIKISIDRTIMMIKKISA